MTVVLKRPPRDGLVRALPNSISRRAASAADPDGDGDAGPLGTFTGNFIVFDSWTEINSYYEGTFLESIAPGAIKKTIQEGRDTIRCLFQHGMDFQVGDKPLGPVAVLEETAEGGYCEVPLIDTSYNRDLAPGIDAGLYGQSFCFVVIREDFNEEPEPSVDNPKGLPERVLREIRMIEFGPVTFPAYDDTTAGLESASKGMRSMTDEYLAEVLKRDPNTVEQMLKRAARPQEFAELLRSRGVRNVPRTITVESAAGTTRGAGTPAVDPAAPESEAPAETEAQVADETAPAGEVPAGDGEQDRTHPAPPEGADLDGHPRAGRRDTTNTEATRAAADTTEETSMKTLAEFRARQEAIRSRLVEIDSEHGEAVLPEEAQTEYDGLRSELDTNETSIKSIEARKAEVRALAGTPAATAPTPAANATLEGGDGAARGAGFNIQPEHETNPYDLEAILSRARGASSSAARGRIMRDASLRAVDAEKVFFHDRVDVGRAKENIEHLLRHEGMLEGNFRSEIAERILRTGSEEYHRTFVRAIAGAPLSGEELRALASFTGASGGYAVPYTLDPTLIPTSNFSVNPYRAICRQETIVGSNEWKGVTTGAVTVSYAAEAAEASDNTPTLTQPIANPERVQAWIPFSLEAEGDWPAALTEMATLIAEGKDDVEAKEFTLGAGHGSNAPEGILTNTPKVVQTATAKTFVIGDFYALEEALAARFRARGSFVGSRFAYNKIRQFDTAGGAGLWVYLPQGIGNQVPAPGSINPQLAGYSVHECSSYETGLTSTHKILTIGDWRYFLIVDRVGMNIEMVPTVFGAGQKPTGQRGLYAFWRNTSKVLSKEAFRTLEIQ